MLSDMHITNMIPGFTYMPSYITEDEELTLLENIHTETRWNTSLSRRTLHYGWNYPYSGFGKLTRADPIPDWMVPLKTSVEESCECVFDQAIVNEYLPGQGISPHIDHTGYFGDTIAVASLGSSTILMMKHHSKPVESFTIAPRSLHVLKDVTRYVYKHSIPARKKDNGIPRGTRYSVTFRMTNDDV